MIIIIIIIIIISIIIFIIITIQLFFLMTISEKYPSFCFYLSVKLSISIKHFKEVS